MGYTLKIGEATIDYSTEYVEIDCDTVRHDDSPAFGEPTDFTNERWPSYSGWADFSNALGIRDIMYGHDGFQFKGDYFYPLIQQHPGVAPITAAHLAIVKEKTETYKGQHPASDYNLKRAEWLIYWMEWALANCKMPVLVNS
jgi:hypothetical protein